MRGRVVVSACQARRQPDFYVSYLARFRRFTLRRGFVCVTPPPSLRRAPHSCSTTRTSARAATRTPPGWAPLGPAGGQSSSTSHAACRHGRHRRGTGVRLIGSSGSPHEKQSSTSRWMSDRANRLSTGAGHGGTWACITSTRHRTSGSSRILTWDLLATSLARRSGGRTPLGRRARSTPTTRMWTPAAATSASRVSAVTVAPRRPLDPRSQPLHRNNPPYSLTKCRFRQPLQAGQCSGWVCRVEARLYWVCYV